MKNSINKEQDAKKEYMLTEVELVDNESNNRIKLVELSTENVAKIEAMICNDSAYIRSSDKSAAEIRGKKNNEIVYGGSTAYWMSKLKIYLEDKHDDSEQYKKIITGAVKAVDRENSTHINSDKYGWDEITERICNIDKQTLKEYLKDNDELKLFNLISKKTSAPERARENISFASKFCHYACFYIFEGEEQQDKYSIYDGVLKKVLPLYLRYYNLNESINLDDYKQYCEAVDQIRNASSIEISRNGFDHLLWYYYKGRLWKYEEYLKKG